MILKNPKSWLFLYTVWLIKKDTKYWAVKPLKMWFWCFQKVHSIQKYGTFWYSVKNFQNLDVNCLFKHHKVKIEKNLSDKKLQNCHITSFFLSFCYWIIIFLIFHFFCRNMTFAVSLSRTIYTIIIAHF